MLICDYFLLIKKIPYNSKLVNTGINGNADANKISLNYIIADIPINVFISCQRRVFSYDPARTI